MNKKHKSPVLVDARFNKNIDADITIPIVEGNLHNKKLEDYYAGGLLRWSKGNNKNNIFKLYNGFSWQLTDTNNYFFIDFGAGLKFNIFFGNCFAMSLNIYLPYDPAILILDWHPMEMKTYDHTNTCT